jgi:hypothetical protein
MIGTVDFGANWSGELSLLTPTPRFGKRGYGAAGGSAIVSVKLAAAGRSRRSTPL